MSTANRYVDSRVVRARLQKNVEKALDIMETCMADTRLNPKDRYKIASDYLGWFIKIENEIMKAEDHRESMKLKRLTTLIKEVEYDELVADQEELPKPNTDSKFSTKMS